MKPQPAYQSEFVTVYCGDALEILPTMEPGAFGHVITDPPFTHHTSRNARSAKSFAQTGGRKGCHKGRYIEFDGVDGLEQDIATSCLRVAKRWVLIFCALEQIGTYAKAAGKSYVRATAWHRLNPAPQISGDRPGQCHEGAVLLHSPGRRRWNRGGAVLAWYGPTINSFSDPHRGTIGHPTPKPTWIMRDAIDAITDPGETVLDPFAGSGTTAVACLQTGRRCVLIEREPKYVEICVRRVREAEGYGGLFAPDAARAAK